MSHRQAKGAWRAWSKGGLGQDFPGRGRGVGSLAPKIVAVIIFGVTRNRSRDRLGNARNSSRDRAQHRRDRS